MIPVVCISVFAVAIKLAMVAWNRDEIARARHASYMREVWRLR